MRNPRTLTAPALVLLAVRRGHGTPAQAEGRDEFGNLRAKAANNTPELQQKRPPARSTPLSDRDTQRTHMVTYVHAS